MRDDGSWLEEPWRIGGSGSGSGVCEEGREEVADTMRHDGSWLDGPQRENGWQWGILFLFIFSYTDINIISHN